MVSYCVFIWSAPCWALWSLVVFNLDSNLTRNNVAWFLMRDFLRLSSWSGSLGR